MVPARRHAMVVRVNEAKPLSATALAAGGRLVQEELGAPWMLASPDNHGVDIAIWPDPEDLDTA